MRQMETVAALKPADAARSPYFCSGCPHNTGTRFPEGSIAAGGIGCHAMAMYSGPEMMPNTQMGGEGAHWYSMAYFSDMNHIFQNMGDGTYYHRSEEHTSELQSLMRNSYADLCLKKKNRNVTTKQR